jgi:hypothetical protein
MSIAAFIQLGIVRSGRLLGDHGTAIRDGALNRRLHRDVLVGDLVRHLRPVHTAPRHHCRGAVPQREGGGRDLPHPGSAHAIHRHGDNRVGNALERGGSRLALIAFCVGRQRASQGVEVGRVTPSRR